MTKDEFQVIESILALFPEICRASDQRRDYLTSLVLAPNHGEPVQGGPGVSAIERYVEGDRESNNLQIIIDRIVGCLQKLRAEEGKFVELYYFEGQQAYDFEESGSVLYCKRRKICSKLAGILNIYHLVREWREIEQKRRLESAKTVRGPGKGPSSF